MLEVSSGRLAVSGAHLSDGRIILCVPLAPQLQEIVEHRHPCFLVVDVDIGGEEVHIKDDPCRQEGNARGLVVQ